MVHVSAINADASSQSNYGRTKGEGEQAVRKAFPAATIIRPSLVFGPDDTLTNRFANMARLPIVPVIAAKTNFQPVYVRDLGKAIALAALDPETHGGNTYEIGGPQTMTMVELHQAIIALTGQTPHLLPMPDLFGMLCHGWASCPAPAHARPVADARARQCAVRDAPGLEAFGIKPTPLAAVGGEWLDRFHAATASPAGEFI